MARITRALNDTGIPCPAAADRARNPHRDGRRWEVLNTVRAVLTNPRCTGRQVWNRQRADHALVDPANTTLGHRDVVRWNSPNDWVPSCERQQEWPPRPSRAARGMNHVMPPW
ncbi:recombinase family protein [Streptomyces sp. NPDC050564]|uniref:recombinase family protein n=1 Tax=Streptomyces sp. NPDC050564 TaxID=3365631 RepID=UPI0037BC5B70